MTEVNKRKADADDFIDHDTRRPLHPGRGSILIRESSASSSRLLNPLYITPVQCGTSQQIESAVPTLKEIGSIGETNNTEQDLIYGSSSKQSNYIDDKAPFLSPGTSYFDGPRSGIPSIVTTPSDIIDRVGSTTTSGPSISLVRSLSDPPSARVRGRFKRASKAITQTIKSQTIKPQTCQRCKELDLDFDKFVMPSRTASGPFSKHPSFTGERSMGTLDEISSRRLTCALCDLLTIAFDKQRTTQTGNNPLCKLAWVTDGMELEQDEQANRRLVHDHRTRRLQILWKRSATDHEADTHEKAYIVLVAPHASFRAVDAPGGAPEERATLFLGRLLTSFYEVATDSYELAERWLSICTGNHGNKCGAEMTLRKRYGSQLLRSTFFTVIDVEELCLKTLPNEPGADKRYVAVSYTWPRETAFEASQRNLSDLRKFNGILRILKLLPKEIQDAVWLTRKLKIKYMWVDSLCITQDSKINWDRNANIMDVIYGNAELTICAADDDAKENGLKALHDPEKYVRHAEQHTRHYNKGRDPTDEIQLLLSHPSETYIARSRWAQRGWTLQERLLSPRCLIFVDGRMYFQCRSTTMAEDIYSDDPRAGWFVEQRESPANILLTLEKTPVTVYRDFVHMYTERSLSRETDVLTAFSGITNLVRSKLGPGCQMLFGLPSSHFDWALLWEPDSRLIRRQDQGQNPTWSWCGWKCETGRICFKESRIVGSGAEFIHDDWVQKRTWITYYIRDNFGILRLVWDPLLHDGRFDIEQWNGYGSPKECLPTTEPPEVNTRTGLRDFHGRPYNTQLPSWGRLARAECHFKRTIPGADVKVVVQPAGEVPEDDFNRRVPQWDDKYLQFWTWSAMLFLDEEAPESPFSRGGDPGKGLKRFGIMDKAGSLAGTCVLDEKWSEAAKNKTPQEFIALSYARRFDESECSMELTYLGPDTGTDWQLFNVMMVEYQKGDEYAIASRAGIGKVIQTVFKNGIGGRGRNDLQWCKEVDKMYWKEIILG